MGSFTLTSIFTILLCCKVADFAEGEILNLTLADLQELQVSGREWNLDDKQAEYIALYFDNAGRFDCSFAVFHDSCDHTSSWKDFLVCHLFIVCIVYILPSVLGKTLKNFRKYFWRTLSLCVFSFSDHRALVFN